MIDHSLIKGKDVGNTLVHDGNPWRSGPPLAAATISVFVSVVHA